MQPSLPDPSTRRHDLDWLRVIAFALLILYHVGMFYVTWGWHVKSDHASAAIEPAMALLNPWRLALLFFISGVALRFAAARREAGPLARERMKRLLIPLAFAMLVVVVPQAYLELRFKGEIGPGYLAFYPRYLGFGDSDFSIITPTWNHLWYVAYVLVYTLLLLAIAPLLRWVEAVAGQWFSHVLDARPMLILLLAAPFVLYQTVLAPLFPTTHALIDDWATHSNFFTVMLIGWLAGGSVSFWRAVDANLRHAVMLVVALGVVIVVARLNWAEVRSIGIARSAIGMLTVVYAWSAIVALLGLARRYLTRSSPFLAYASEAVFPWYILHQTIIVMVGYAMIGSGVPAAWELAIVLGATVGGCLLLHELVIRRVRWLRPLFGLKPGNATQTRVARAPFAFAKKHV